VDTQAPESELDQPGAIERASRKGVTVKDMIDQYLLEVGKARPLGKTKKATLEAIGKMDIGQLNDTDLTTQCLVDFALFRMSGEGGGVQPQTAGNDLAHLGAVLAIAKDAWGYQVDPLAMAGARRVLRKLGYKPQKSGACSPSDLGRAGKGADALPSHANAAPECHQHAQGRRLCPVLHPPVG